MSIGRKRFNIKTNQLVAARNWDFPKIIYQIYTVFIWAPEMLSTKELSNFTMCSANLYEQAPMLLMICLSGLSSL